MVKAMENQTCTSCENICEPGEELCRTCRILETGSKETLKADPDFRQKSARARLFGDDSVPHATAMPREVETIRRTKPESISGKFTLVKKVGAGGAGEVWKAWDESIHRWIALKFLKNEEEINIQLFQREARMVGGLNHPHIIPIYEMGILGEHHYIAMQFVEGTTLREFVRMETSLVVGLIRDAAIALQYAHENDVVHRDIKPSNFLVEEHGSTRSSDTPSRHSKAGHHLYVADFGLAKQVSVESSL
ncbi:MAG: serine/threonine-protein kinase, partial [Planctomycetota bacterium]|nr:serine/threonine-protein kinase [Planctomycetota bacterium]